MATVGDIDARSLWLVAPRIFTAPGTAGSSAPPRSVDNLGANANAWLKEQDELSCLAGARLIGVMESCRLAKTLVYPRVSGDDTIDATELMTAGPSGSSSRTTSGLRGTAGRHAHPP